MKKFLIKITFLVLSILAIAVLIEALLRYTPNDYSFKKQYLDSHSSEIETLILGSSHSFFGFNPTFFSSNTFNASHVSQSLDYDFKILERYQSRFENLKTIILPISYFSLFSKINAGTESWRETNYKIYYKISTSKSLINSEVLSNSFYITMKKLALYYIFGRSPIYCSELGWGTTYKSENSQELIGAGKRAALRHSVNINDVQSKIIFKENKQTLNSIILWCKNRDIRIVLLTPPAFETYFLNLNKQQLRLTIEIATKMDLDNGNCTYLNLLEDTHFVAADFYDADHLSEIGAEKLSRLINEQINNLK